MLYNLLYLTRSLVFKGGSKLNTATYSPVQTSTQCMRLHAFAHWDVQPILFLNGTILSTRTFIAFSGAKCCWPAENIFLLLGLSNGGKVQGSFMSLKKHSAQPSVCILYSSPSTGQTTAALQHSVSDLLSLFSIHPSHFLPLWQGSFSKLSKKETSFSTLDKSTEEVTGMPNISFCLFSLLDVFMWVWNSGAEWKGNLVCDPHERRKY